MCGLVVSRQAVAHHIVDEVHSASHLTEYCVTVLSGRRAARMPHTCLWKYVTELEKWSKVSGNR